MTVHTDTVGGMTPASRVLTKPPWALGEIIRWFLVAQLGPILVLGILLIVVFGEDGFPDSTPIWLLVVSSLFIWIGYGVGTIFETRRSNSRKGVEAQQPGHGPEFELGLKAPLSLVAGAVVLGVLTQLVLLPALYWPILQFNPDLDVGEAAENLVADYDHWLEIAIFIFVAVVAAPLVEELFYRGLVLRGLTHYMHPALSVVLSALVFAGVHFQLVQLPGLFLFGLIAGAIVYFTGRVGVAIVLHMAFNLTAVIGLFFV